jgi:DNA repair protein RadC
MRLKARLRRAGAGALSDYELIELLLCYAIGRRDTKPMAKALLERFRSLRAVLDAAPIQLEKTPGIGPHASTLLSLVKALLIRYLEPEEETAPVLSGPESVADYLRGSLGSEPRERFMILCMNASGRLVHHAVISEGTVDAACVYPREVIRTAIEADAVSIILVHNHPSGALKPSEQDIRLTRELSDLCRRMGITLNDHFVVSRHGLYSITLGREI